MNDITVSIQANEVLLTFGFGSVAVIFGSFGSYQFQGEVCTIHGVAAWAGGISTVYKHSSPVGFVACWSTQTASV